MAPQDDQHPADSSSEATTSDAEASQDAPASAACRPSSLSSSRTRGKQLRGYSVAASTDADSASQAASSDDSSPVCLKRTNQDVSKRPCLKNTKCLKKGPCLNGATRVNLGGQTPVSDSSMASSSAVDSASELEPSEKNDASTDASTPGADSSKGDASDTDTHKSGAESSVDSGGWSNSEDCLLRSLKESKDDLPWVEIGAVLGRTKNDVRARWVAIRDQLARFAYSDEASGEEPESSGVKSQESLKPSKKPVRISDDARGALDQRPWGASEPDRDATGKGKAKAASQSKWHKGQRNDNMAMENKSARSRAARANECDRDILSGEEASSESLGPLCDGEDDDEDDVDADADAGGLHYGWPESKRQDVRYLRDHVYPELYPGAVQPESDEFFGEHDCAVLAAVDSKYKRSRWLEMQANFYNVTGRMVPLYLFRDKLERAEAQQPSSRADERWERVESWVRGVHDGDLEDPAH